MKLLLVSVVVNGMRRSRFVMVKDAPVVDITSMISDVARGVTFTIG